MTLEVERKFRVPDFRELKESLRRLDAGWLQEVVQIDQYYVHPCRDFAQTDEALRIRHTGDECRITYKGKRQAAESKTRREIEFLLPDARQAAQLLEALGFRPVVQVRKQRQRASLYWNNHGVEISLDNVEEVGQFVELELMAEDETAEAASNVLHSLANELGLAGEERRSYLELLLAARSK